jgi:hypothetical protein
VPYKDPERRRQRRRELRQEHLEEARAYSRAWSAANPDRIKTYRQNTKRNPAGAEPGEQKRRPPAPRCRLCGTKPDDPATLVRLDGPNGAAYCPGECVETARWARRIARPNLGC